MEKNYASYLVEKKNLKFVSDDGRKYPKTAIISFLDDNGEPISTDLLGFIESTEIYAMIERGEQLILDQCYIEGFSLSHYRQSKGLDKKSHISLKGFSAVNSFFEAHIETDFSYADFGDSDISFEGSHFARGSLNLHGILSGKGNFNLSCILLRDGNLDLNSSNFGDGKFELKNSVLCDGTKDFQDIVFSNGDISFANTEFASGDLLFINTNFGNGLFSFKIARVNSGRIDFHYATFGEGDVVFERAEFGDARVDFRAVDFGKGRINFNRSVFGNGEIVFEGASFSGSKFFFKRVSMGNGTKDFTLMEMALAEISFEKTEFGSGELNFNSSAFKVLSLRSCHLDHYVDLRIASAEVLDLSDSIVRDIIDLEPFNKQFEVKLLDFSGMRLVGKLYMDWKNNNCREVIMRQENTSLRQKSEQFRILKENFNVTGKYDDEDKAYIMFKRLESKADLDSRIKEVGKFKAIPAYLSYGFRWLVFDAAGQYATNPIRVLFTMLVSFTIFSLLYVFMMLFSRSDIIASVDDHLSLVARAFYHSAITFLTIGYGDHYPYGSIRWMSGVEGFVGLFLMSYFTVAFVRKILR